jgi:hypothetical protein
MTETRNRTEDWLRKLAKKVSADGRTDGECVSVGKRKWTAEVT